MVFEPCSSNKCFLPNQMRKTVHDSRRVSRPTHFEKSYFEYVLISFYTRFINFLQDPRAIAVSFEACVMIFLNKYIKNM